MLGGLEVTDNRAARRDNFFSSGEPIDDVEGALGGLAVHELPVDGHDGGVRARGLALDALEPEGAVHVALVVAGAEAIRDRVVDGVTTEERAKSVGAHTNVVLAHRAALVHRVEGRDRGDLGRGEAELLGDDLHALGRDLIVDALREVQQGHHRGPGMGVARDDLAHLRHDALVVGHQRSTPPMTGSMLATAAMTSEIMLPLDIAAVDCRLLKDASRKCTR